MERLTEFVIKHLNDDTSRLILDRSKYPEIDIDLAVSCIESRRKLKGKVQEWYDQPGLIFPLKLSAEQCSSSTTGKYKAELAQKIAERSLDFARDDKEEARDDIREARDDIKGWTLADLTGGLGVDSWFFSHKASKVVYCEMQEALCKAASHNYKILNAENIIVNNLMITSENCRMLAEHAPDIIYMDPARRGEGGKKVFLIEDCTPDVLGLKDELFKISRHLLIKLSPMADITMVCDRLGDTCREVHVVATGGECKELLIWMDRDWHQEATIHAVELHTNTPSSIFTYTQTEEKATIYTETPHNKDCWQCGGIDMPPPVRGRERLANGPVDLCSEQFAGSQAAGVNGATCQQSAAYLFEPGKALMKAAPYNLIAARFGICKLGKSTHYYIVDSSQKADELKQYGKVFAIKEWLSLDKRTIKEVGKKYPKAEVTARNIPMDTDTLRKKLGVTSGDDAHIFGLKSDSEGNLLIVADRI